MGKGCDFKSGVHLRVLTKICMMIDVKFEADVLLKVDVLEGELCAVVILCGFGESC